MRNLQPSTFVTFSWQYFKKKKEKLINLAVRFLILLFVKKNPRFRASSLKIINYRSPNEIKKLQNSDVRYNGRADSIIFKACGHN